jgi:hypothetical protein
MPNLLEKALVNPLTRIGEQFAAIVPAVILVVLILVVGGLLAYAVRWLVYRLLVAVRFDHLAARSGLAGTIERTGIFQSASDFGARVVQGLVWLLIVLVALDATGAPVAETLVVRFASYVPNLLSAGLVLLLGSLVSKFLARSALLGAVNAQWPAARLVAGGVRVLVMAMAVAIALEELRIGRTVVLVSFAILFAGIITALAIAFGMGARDIARTWLQSKITRGAPEDQEVFRHF